LIGVFKTDAFQTKIDAVEPFVEWHLSKNVERKHYVLFDVLGVEESATLEQHTDFAANFSLRGSVAVEETTAIIDHRSFVRFYESYDTFQQHTLSRTAGTDNKIRFPLLEDSADVFQYGLVTE